MELYLLIGRLNGVGKLDLLHTVRALIGPLQIQEHIAVILIAQLLGKSNHGRLPDTEIIRHLLRSHIEDIFPICQNVVRDFCLGVSKLGVDCPQLFIKHRITSSISIFPTAEAGIWAKGSPITADLRGEPG